MRDVTCVIETIHQNAAPSIHGLVNALLQAVADMAEESLSLTYIIYWTKHARNDPCAEVQRAEVTYYIPTGRRHDPALL